MAKNSIPKDGFAGFRENWKDDSLSGFLVFILAVPLSMGIAQASDFPVIYGLITAMIGGIVVSFLAGSPLTIKGPAAGLIVIVAGAVSEFGGGTIGWQYALGAIVVAGIVQVLFGLLKLGKMGDFFPLSAVHGMLAAIGIIIMSKQFHGLLGQNPIHGWLDATLPAAEASKPLVEPFELFEAMPHSISNFNQNALIVGLVSLVIVFVWPMLKVKALKKIPAPVVVLAVAIPLAKSIGLDSKLFVTFDKGLIESMGVNVNFGGLAQMGTFIKYVIMFALVGSLEALLTVKAIDMLDPYKRKSNSNKDLIAVGIGNIFAGVLGGLPMISEVARSSANIHNGGKTRWANFFHGIFILLFLLFAVVFSGIIPKPALAAMLIGVGFRLAHPREFYHMFHIGKEQLVIFIGTVLATLATDLLIGIGVGIVIKLIFEMSVGVKPKEIFKADVMINEKGEEIEMNINSSVIFSNYLSLNKMLQSLTEGKSIVIDLSESPVVDHSAMENLRHFASDYNRKGGSFKLYGLDNHRSLSSHEDAVRVKNKK
jgi:MFS superfamily sulfate permease-like transporter